MDIQKWNPQEEGELSEEKLTRKLEALGYSVTLYTYPPGTFFPDHTHSVDKIDAVLSGRFLMTTPEGEIILEAGDMLAVPRGMRHSARVLGDQDVVSLDAIRAS